MSTAIVKQPSETYTLAFAYQGKLPAGASLSSGEVFASQQSAPQQTTLSASAAAGAMSVSMAGDVGKGARLTLAPGSAHAEVVKVSAVTGSGPYTATIVPSLMFAHASGEPVTYEPSVSSDLLGSSVATIDATTQQARVVLQRGVHRQRYRVSMLVTLTNGDRLEDEVTVHVLDR
jgi:hypothetical protein